jgi:hypothetical protein
MKKIRVISAILLLWSMLVYVGCRKDKFESPQDQTTAAAEQNATARQSSGSPGNALAAAVGDQFQYPPGAHTTVDLSLPEEEGPEEQTSDARLRSKLTDAGRIDRTYIDNTVPTRLYWIAEGLDKQGRHARWAIPILGGVIHGVIIIRVCVYIYYVVCYQITLCRFIRDPWTGRIIGISCVQGLICYFYYIKYCYWIVIFFREADVNGLPISRMPAMLPKRE